MKPLLNLSVHSLTLASLLSITFLSTSSLAQSTIPKVICSKNSNGTLALRSKCRRGETTIRKRSSLIGSTGATGAAGASGSAGADGAPGAAGSPGADGATGADGASRIYGDASGGDLTISTNTNFSSENSQFDDVTITSSGTYSFPAGTIFAS